MKDATGGRGASVVLDAVGGSLGEQAIRATANGGRFGVYGFASGDWIPLDARQIAERGLTITGPLGIVFAKAAAEQRADVEQALAATATGLLRPRIHATFPLERAADAHIELEQRRTSVHSSSRHDQGDTDRPSPVPITSRSLPGGPRRRRPSYTATPGTLRRRAARHPDHRRPGRRPQRTPTESLPGSPS